MRKRSFISHILVGALAALGFAACGDEVINVHLWRALAVAVYAAVALLKPADQGLAQLTAATLTDGCGTRDLDAMERFVAVLLEHTGGKFPLWLTPEQAVVLPISEKYNDYAKKVAKLLNNCDIRTRVDERNEKIGRKIRDNELARTPILLIVGEAEQANETVTVRMQGEGKDRGAMTLPEFTKTVADKVAEEIRPISENL